MDGSRHQTDEGWPARPELLSPDDSEATVSQLPLDLRNGSHVVDGVGKARAYLGSVGSETQHQGSPGSEHSFDLSQLIHRIRPEIKHVYGERSVEALGLKGQVCGFASMYRRAARVDRVAHAAGREAHHHLGGVDTGNETPGVATG